MTRYLGAGGASAIAAACILAIPSSEASAQVAALPVPVQPVSAVMAAPAPATAAPVAAQAPRPLTTAELWPIIWANMQGPALDEETNCIAVAVYHEARGEPFAGQLAVAEVVMNRAYSGRYPNSYCGVVKQPWQFSFVRAGRLPPVNAASPSWAYAQSIARIAKARSADLLPDDVLWYHADYVAPSWGRRLSRVEKIGAHIFYRA